jgi:hypothetical protein
MFNVRLISLLLLLIVSSVDAGIITTQWLTKDGRTVGFFGDQHEYFTGNEHDEKKWEEMAFKQWDAIKDGLDAYGEKNKQLTVLYEGRELVDNDRVSINKELDKECGNLEQFLNTAINLNFSLLPKNHFVKCVNIERRDYILQMDCVIGILLHIAKFKEPGEWSQMFYQAIPIHRTSSDL